MFLSFIPSFLNGKRVYKYKITDWNFNSCINGQPTQAKNENDPAMHGACLRIIIAYYLYFHIVEIPEISFHSGSPEQLHLDGAGRCQTCPAEIYGPCLSPGSTPYL